MNRLTELIKDLGHTLIIGPDDLANLAQQVDDTDKHVKHRHKVIPIVRSEWKFVYDNTGSRQKTITIEMLYLFRSRMDDKPAAKVDDVMRARPLVEAEIIDRLHCEGVRLEAVQMAPVYNIFDTNFDGWHLTLTYHG